MKLNKYKLGSLIKQRREKNNNYNVPIKGVSKEGFIDPKQKDADTKLYNVFYKNDFVFNPAIALIATPIAPVLPPPVWAAYSPSLQFRFASGL